MNGTNWLVFLATIAVLAAALGWRRLHRKTTRPSKHAARPAPQMDGPVRVAIDLVKSGETDACVSAGNTGALMTISRFVLKMLPGIERPAICAVLPTMSGHVHVLDLGANVDCSHEHLLQFGIMGASLVGAVEHKDRPSVGILNIGEEDIKGNEVVKLAGY